MSSPAFNKKLQGILKAQSEETQQTSRPHSDMTQIIELSNRKFKITMAKTSHKCKK